MNCDSVILTNGFDRGSVLDAFSWSVGLWQIFVFCGWGALAGAPGRRMSGLALCHPHPSPLPLGDVCETAFGRRLRRRSGASVLESARSRGGRGGFGRFQTCLPAVGRAKRRARPMRAYARAGPSDSFTALTMLYAMLLSSSSVSPLASPV